MKRCSVYARAQTAREHHRRPLLSVARPPGRGRRDASRGERPYLLTAPLTRPRPTTTWRVAAPVARPTSPSTTAPAARSSVPDLPGSVAHKRDGSGRPPTPYLPHLRNHLPGPPRPSGRSTARPPAAATPNANATGHAASQKPTRTTHRAGPAPRTTHADQNPPPPRCYGPRPRNATPWNPLPPASHHRRSSGLTRSRPPRHAHRARCCPSPQNTVSKPVTTPADSH